MSLKTTEPNQLTNDNQTLKQLITFQIVGKFFAFLVFITTLDGVH